MAGRVWLLLLAGLAGFPQDAPKKHPIDAVLDAYWERHGIQPAPEADDAEFLRRVHLDLTGVIPTADQVRAFLRRPDRAAKIEELLSSPWYAKYWTEKLTNDWLGYGSGYFFGDRVPFKKWLRERIEAGERYDVLVRALICEDSAFLRRWMSSPEDLMTRISRSFLGVPLDCARCHDHPFDRWTQEDFYSMTAFFAGLRIKEGSKLYEVVLPEEVKFEGYPRPVRPRFLDGTRPGEKRPRVAFARWLTGPENRQFARAFANRVWAYFFGRGVVEPFDDLSEKNKPVVPGLLDVLADEFVRSGYDMRALMRLVVTSRAYQRTSRRQASREGEAFSRAAVRPLLPEQFLYSLMRATGRRLRGEDFVEFKGEVFRIVFENADIARLSNVNLTQYSASVQQVLRLLDLDNDIFDGLRVHGRGLLDEVIRECKSPEEIVERMYLTVLSRPPTDVELHKCLAYFRKKEEYLNAWEDILWALVNSNEFFFNH